MFPKNHVFFLICMFKITKFATAENWVCNNTAGNFTANDMYDRNRRSILASLASKVQENGGFYNAAVGEDPDKVYATGFCIADLSSDDCSLCIQVAVGKIYNICLEQKEVITWIGDPPCIIRYANRSFFGILELNPYEIGCNAGDLNLNMTQFDLLWGNLMVDVMMRAANGTSPRFATGEANLTSNQTMYTLMQCSPDLSESDCYICLNSSVNVFHMECHGKKGGYLQRPGCIWRWDLYRFYESSLPPVISPSPTPRMSPLDSDSPNTTPANRNGSISRLTIIIVVVSSVVSNVSVILCVWICLKLRMTRISAANEMIKVESLQYDFATVSVATNNFCDGNKLGRGGFGSVYKGKLQNGQEVAIKRLSSGSGQGDSEFRNEVLLLAKLQHRNLVRLLGFCLEGDERLLIYEFVPNTSLDRFIFDPINRLQLDWGRRYKIIGGIARGLLYLHEDSHLRIIHCDLKASNILLDEDINSKIADFGMARLFLSDEAHGNTSSIVGTYGYMAPEYAMHGQFSLKSDVYSFGVLVLEIVCGKKNGCFQRGDNGEDPLQYAWKRWREGTGLDLIDPILTSNGSSTAEMMKCIHIGLLCVQENVADRPTMASVVHMLSGNSTALPVPSEPRYVTYRHNIIELELDSNRPKDEALALPLSTNEVTITELFPR